MKLKYFILSLFFILSNKFPYSVAFAQSASQLTAPSYRPPLEHMEKGEVGVPTNEGLNVPEGAEKLFIQLSSLKVEGGFAELAEETQSLTTKLTGKRISAAEIFKAARILETAYAKAGYVLARVILPPQTLLDGGELKLVVIDGFIEKIETKNVPDRVRERILNVLEPLRQQKHLHLSMLERKLLLAGDTPGVILHSTLAPGDTVGATILIIDATHQPLDEISSLDNSLSGQLGRWNLGLGLDANSICTFGELIYLRANGNPAIGSNGFLNSDPRYRSLAVGFVLPLGVDGLNVNMEAVEARTAPVPTADITSTDVYQRFSVRLRYPWLRSRTGNFNIEGDLDIEDETQRLSTEDTVLPLFADRLRVLRIAGDGNWLVPDGGTLSGRVTASFGVPGLGARSAEAASPLLPLSRQGADSEFQKAEIRLTYIDTLADHLGVNLFAHAQTSFGQALARSEQVGIATPYDLSTFNQGTLQGDAGVMLRAELVSPWRLPLDVDPYALLASPYIFGAGGKLYLRHLTTIEQGEIDAVSYGLGLRINGFSQSSLSNASLGLEWGRQNANITPTHGNRFTMIGSIKF